MSRIRWDKKFGEGRFEIAHYDRYEGTVHRVALSEVVFPEDERHTFEIVDEFGQRRHIPFHRVREVVRDGQIIWQRQPLDQDAA